MNIFQSNQKEELNKTEMLKGILELDFDTQKFLSDDFVANFSKLTNDFYVASNTNEKINILKPIAKQLFKNMLVASNLNNKYKNIDEKIEFSIIQQNSAYAFQSQGEHKIYINPSLVDDVISGEKTLLYFISAIIHETTHFIQQERMGYHNFELYQLYDGYRADNQNEQAIAMAFKDQLFENLNKVLTSPDFLKKIEKTKEKIENSNIGQKIKNIMLEDLKNYSKPLDEKQRELLADSFYIDATMEKEAFFMGLWLAKKLATKLKLNILKNNQPEVLKDYEREELLLNKEFDYYIYEQQTHQLENNVYNMIGSLTAKEFVQFVTLNIENPLEPEALENIPEEYDYNPVYQEFYTTGVNYNFFEMFKKGGSWLNNKNELISEVEKSDNLILKLQFAEYGLPISTIQQDFKSVILSDKKDSIVYKLNLFKMLNDDNKKLLSNYISEINNPKVFRAFSTTFTAENYSSEMFKALKNLNDVFSNKLQKEQDVVFDDIKRYFEGSLEFCEKFFNNIFESKTIEKYELSEVENFSRILTDTSSIISKLLKSNYNPFNYELTSYSYMLRSKYKPFVENINKKVQEMLANAPGGLE